MCTLRIHVRTLSIHMHTYTQHTHNIRTHTLTQIYTGVHMLANTGRYTCAHTNRCIHTTLICTKHTHVQNTHNYTHNKHAHAHTYLHTRTHTSGRLPASPGHRHPFARHPCRGIVLLFSGLTRRVLAYGHLPGSGVSKKHLTYRLCSETVAPIFT